MFTNRLFGGLTEAEVIEVVVDELIDRQSDHGNQADDS